MAKKYLVTFKTNQTQTVEGVIRFFSSSNPIAINDKASVYLNADDVMSIIEQPEETVQIVADGKAFTLTEGDTKDGLK